MRLEADEELQSQTQGEGAAQPTQKKSGKARGAQAREDENYRYYLEFCRLEYSRQVLMHQLNIAMQEQNTVQARLQKMRVSG